MAYNLGRIGEDPVAEFLLMPNLMHFESGDGVGIEDPFQSVYAVFCIVYTWLRGISGSYLIVKCFWMLHLGKVPCRL